MEQGQFPPAPDLEMPTHLADGASSLGFLSQVGGVAFGGMATGGAGQRIAAIRYEAEKPDGQRLSVVLRGSDGVESVVAGVIPDWQLVPIARFAASDQDSCFTLFGKLLDPRDTEARRQRGEKILNYHSAFKDTLLGLRLFQADILVLYPDACDLPKAGAVPILGAGEAPPDVEGNRRALHAVHQTMRAQPDDPFQSYLICDKDVPVNFGMSNGRLVLTGEPIWLCWKMKPGDATAVQARANEEANRLLREIIGRDEASMTHAAVAAKWTSEAQQSTFRRIFDEIVSRELLQPMPRYTVALSSAIRSQNGVNRAVYDSLVITMRFAALFRRFRSDEPKAFDDFLRSLEGVNLTPAVRTPTVLVPPTSPSRHGA